MPVNRATLRVSEEVRRLLRDITDAQTNSLVALWVEAWDRVGGELDAAILSEAMTVRAGGRVTWTQLNRSQRLQRALDEMAVVLDGVASQAGVTITGDLQRAISGTVTAEAAMIASQLPSVAANLVRADARQISAMLTRATEQITSLTLPLGAEATAAVRAELVRGITVGANPRVAARRMVRGLEDRFNGGLNRALVISRTEMLDAHRTAAQVIDRANADLMGSWTWMASLSERTCEACLAMHGSVHPISEPGPLGHQQCRCARIPKTKTWAELGFTDVVEPPSLEPGPGDGVRWLEQQDRDTQRQILGSGRHDAWLEGRYPPDRWAIRTSTEGWRDSYRPGRPTPP